MADSAIIIVSHNEAQLYRLCDSALWMDGGLTLESGMASRVLNNYCAHESANSSRSNGELVLSSNVLDLNVKSSGEIFCSGSQAVFVLEILVKEVIELSSISLHFSRNGDFVCYARADLGSKMDLCLCPGLTESKPRSIVCLWRKAIILSR